MFPLSFLCFTIILFAGLIANASSSYGTLGQQIVEQDAFASIKNLQQLNNEFSKSVDVIHKEINKANDAVSGLETKVKDVTNLLEDNEDIFQELKLSGTEQLCELEDELDDKTFILDMSRRRLSTSLQQLTTTVNLNRAVVNKQMQESKGKYGKTKHQIKDLIDEVFKGVGALKRLANPFEAPGAIMDLIDVVIRAAPKVVDFVKDIVEKVEDLTG